MSGTIKSNTENLQADIVVVGGGVAGPTAAVRAAETGAKNVILLEERNRLGGNAVRAGGIFAVESPATKRAGASYTKDQAFLDKMNSVWWQVDPRLVRTLINVSGEVIEWFENKGLVFDVITFLEGDARYGKYSPTGHMARPIESGKRYGAALVETLEKECQKLGVKILTSTTGKKLVTDKNGKVTGILATQKDKEIKIAAKAVVIATGGFPGNKELMKRFFPKQSSQGIFALSLPYKGEGLLMAEEVGAIVDDCVGYFPFSPHHYPYATTLTALVRRPEIICVNKLGERFVDESFYVGNQHYYGPAVGRQPDAICYGLVDTGTLHEMMTRNDPRLPVVSSGLKGIDSGEWWNQISDDFKKDSAKGLAKVADSWDDIAKFIGAKPKVLKATVEQYNSYCDNGYDYDFLKPKEYLFPLRTPPFYAILGRNGFDVTFGGIKVNTRMEVINKSYEPISGLYAGSNVVGGVIALPYHTKFAGTSMGFAIYTSYIAGREAAKYVTEHK